MRVPPRLFMDVSYTRTQHVSMGITRTVRRLEDELRRLCRAEASDFALVSFHTGGFRQVDGNAMLSSVSQGVARASDKPAARLFRWITGSLFRKIVLASLLLPWMLVRTVWERTSAWTFDFLSRAEPPVAFRQGDILLLCDASWNYPVWTAARKARAQGARIVLLMYDLIPLRHPQFCFALVPLVFRLWLECMLSAVDAVVCISRATENDLRQLAVDSVLRLPPTGSFRLGSDPIRDGQSQNPVRSELARFLDGDLPCFAAIGSFEPKKNYDFLVDVFERLWTRGLKFRLLIIGRQSAESHELIRRVRNHPQQGLLLLTLFDASDSEVAYIYGHCRALVFPSLAEGFGLPLVEARTRGSHVIASSLPCFVELADDGVSIYPEGSYDALERLLVEHAAGGSIVKAAPMSQFTWEDSAHQLLKLIQELLTDSGRC